MIEWIKSLFKKNSYWVEGDLKSITQTIEVDLNENDLLVFKYDKFLTNEQRETLVKNLDSIVTDKNKKTMVLEGGVDITVIHRA